MRHRRGDCQRAFRRRIAECLSLAAAISTHATGSEPRCSPATIPTSETHASILQKAPAVPSRRKLMVNQETRCWNR
jgi:hypothetical protein